MALTDKLTAIADAIRAKTGGTEALTLDEMATEISDISGGGGDSSVVDSLIEGILTEISSNAETVKAYCFYNIPTLKKVDFPKATIVRGAAFNACYSLQTVILRSETLCSLASTTAFNSCFRFHGTVNATYNPDGLKDGYIYVPTALMSSYKAASNWSTFATQFRALEDYTVDKTTTGELDESKI